MSKKTLTTKHLQNITEVASVAEGSNHRKNNGYKVTSNEMSANLTSSNNTTLMRGLIGADDPRQSKMSEPFGTVNAGQDEGQPGATRNFGTGLAKAGKASGGAGEATGKFLILYSTFDLGRNLENTLNSKDSGRYTGFKSYDTTKMPIGTEKEEL